MNFSDFEDGAPNLDCLNVAELRELTKLTTGNRPINTARALFPNNVVGRVRAVKDINAYAWNKITARWCREAGDIESALKYELICERIYQRLPDFARW